MQSGPFVGEGAANACRLLGTQVATLGVSLWGSVVFSWFFNGIPLQYYCLEHPMDRGGWKAAVHGVIEGQTQLRDFTFTFHFHALEKEMATHSSTFAWKIPWVEKPGRLQSMGSQRVGHD